MTEFTKRFKDCSLENFRVDTEETKDMVDYIKSCLESGFNDNVVIMGGVGLGKTHIAYAIVNKLEEVKKSYSGSETYTNKKVDIVNVKKIIDNIRATWKSTADKYDFDIISGYKKVPLLIIDEVGVQYGSESERTELFEIINNRYNDMLPTMIISNCNKEQISIILGQRIVDRIFGGAKIFELRGYSKR